MQVIETPLVEEGKMEIVEQPEQPLASPQPAFQPGPALDEATVRAAVMQAEASGEDPTKLKVRDVAETPQQPEKAQAETPADVPEKFKKPNGEVDVEKLNASTKHIDEVIQQKEAKISEAKVIEEALRQYKEKEQQLRAIPNPARIVQPPAAPAPAQQQQDLTDQQLEAMINADLAQNPARTVAQLVQLALQRELQPFTEERKDNQIRTNLQELVAKDPRAIQHMAAINAKLDADPELRRLKNPHKSAWLEVKEELRLGELSQAQAQPRNSVAPVLGGGTPPPTPSSSAPIDANTVLAATKQLGSDPRNKTKFDPKQWDKMDAIARQLFK